MSMTATQPLTRGASRMLRQVAAGLLGFALLCSGCTGQSEVAADAAPARDGGVLHLLAEAADFAHIDPQRVREPSAANLTRLFARTLTTYRQSAGAKQADLVPDLATDLGRPTENNTIWRFTLKSGVRWQDGANVTCQDVKHGVERGFSSLLDEGASLYPRSYLAGGAAYRGPYVGGNNGSRGLGSVRCLDLRTVEFHLSRPATDFGSVVALPVFAPVRESKDTREEYDNQPFSNGPYQVASYGKINGRKRLVLRRNPNWDPRTDLTRKQHPRKIVVSFGHDADTMTNRLLSDRGSYRRAVALDVTVPPRFVQQVINDPKLSARTVTGMTSGVLYLAINSASVKASACRRALTLGVDKQALRTALGGAMHGDYATSILPPTMRSGKSAGTSRRLSPDGDPDQARKLIAGNDCPEALTLDHMDTPHHTRAADAIVEAYRRIGVSVTKNPVPGHRYLDVVTVPEKQHDLVLARWVPDLPRGAGTIPALFDGRQIRTGAAGNVNFSLVDDDRLNRLIDKAYAEPDQDAQQRMWEELDRKVVQMGLVAPILFERSLQLVGSGVRETSLHPAYLGVDLSVVGVA